MRRLIHSSARLGGLCLVLGLAAITLHGFAEGDAPEGDVSPAGTTARLAVTSEGSAMAMDWGECSACHGSPRKSKK